MGTLLLFAGKVVLGAVTVAVPFLGSMQMSADFPVDHHNHWEEGPALPPGEIPVAKPVPGKPGFCFSPFNGNIIDVQGIPPGTLVQDPSVLGERQIFRVP